MKTPHRVSDLRELIADWEADGRSPRGAELILRIALTKIASGSCGHPPTWAKELLKLVERER